MSSPHVSVVLPTFNRATTLAAAAHSVLNQSYSDLELLVVDGQSDDHTPGVLEALSADQRVRVIHAPQRGCAAQRNHGVSLAKGSYVAFQDSDDQWLPGRLEQTLAVLEQDPSSPGVSYSDMLFEHTDGRETTLVAPEVKRGRLVNPKTLDYEVFGLGIQSVVMHRECFEWIGPFDETLPRFIDLDFFIRAANHFPFRRIPRVLVRHVEGSGISANPTALAEARKALMHKYETPLRKHRLHWAAQHLLTAKALSYDSDLEGALVYAETAQRLGRWHPRFYHQARAFARLARKAIASAPPSAEASKKTP